MEPVTREEIELIVKDAIAAHELRFSVFGLLTVSLLLLLGLAIANAPSL